MIRGFVWLIALLLAFPAAAHQQKITLSSVAHNPRSDTLEVVHRVPLHDAEHALKTQGQSAPDIVNDLESRRAFARYVAKRFSIALGEEPIALTLLGTEIEGGYLLVFQEAPSPGLGAQLTIQSGLLTDVWAKQENRVNLGDGTQVETLIFRAGDSPKTGALK